MSSELLLGAGVLLYLFCSIGIGLNVTVCVHLLRHCTELICQQTAGLFVMNLAVSDTLFLLVGSLYASVYSFDDWAIFPGPVCSIFGFDQMLNHCVMWTTLALVAQRLNAIQEPLIYSQNYTIKTCIYKIVSIWASGILMGVPLSLMYSLEPKTSSKFGQNSTNQASEADISSTSQLNFSRHEQTSSMTGSREISYTCSFNSDEKLFVLYCFVGFVVDFLLPTCYISRCCIQFARQVTLRSRNHIATNLPQSIKWYSITTALACWLCYTPFWISKLALGLAILLPWTTSYAIGHFFLGPRVMIGTIVATYVYSILNPILYWTIRFIKKRRTQMLTNAQNTNNASRNRNQMGSPAAEIKEPGDANKMPIGDSKKAMVSMGASNCTTNKNNSDASKTATPSIKDRFEEHSA